MAFKHEDLTLSAHEERLFCVLYKLAYPISGTLQQTNMIIGMTAHFKDFPCPIYPIDTDQPTHMVCKWIQKNVIDFMQNSMMPSYQLIFATDECVPPDRIDHFVAAYPTLLGMWFRMSAKTPKVTVVDIPMKGKGVVATVDIPANQIVTFYPVDLIEIGEFSCKKQKRAYISRDGRYTKNHHIKILAPYKVTLFGVSTFGDPLEFEDGCCGHMVNDGNGPIKGKNNCIIMPLFGGVAIVLITATPIRKGDELLASYGNAYWKKAK